MGNNGVSVSKINIKRSKHHRLWTLLNVHQQRMDSKLSSLSMHSAILHVD